MGERPFPSSNPPPYQEPDESESSSAPWNRFLDSGNVRNVPYQPNRILQDHIDKLTSTTPITTSASGTRTEYFHLLPSFQLYQSILKKNDFEFDENALGNPPMYGNSFTANQRPLEPFVQNNTASVIDLDNHQVEDGYIFTEDEENDGMQRSPDPTSHSQTLPQSINESHSGTVSCESYGPSVLDHIEKLSIARSSPLTIQIYVTKNVPIPNEQNELENKLKEYSCGDIVNGYVIITNTSKSDVGFGMFVVSLEGAVKTLSQPTTEEAAYAKQPPKIMMKKFLKMYDLNASYNYGIIPSSAGIQYDANTRDEFDNCILGLPDNKILKAGERYKKFITFKFPEMLLDNACPHEVMRHTMPPPSFGVDTPIINGQSLDVNKVLGYGTSSARGSPVKLRDFSFDSVSVSYAIEAKFIDRDTQKPNSQFKHATDPFLFGSKNSTKYVVSKRSLFYLRFVPNVKSQMEAFSRAYKDLREETFEKIGIDGMFFNQLRKSSTWRAIKEMDNMIEDELEADNTNPQLSGEDMKRKNLQLSSSKSEDEEFTPRDLLPECPMAWLPKKNAVQTLQSTSIYAKRRKRFVLNLSKIGELRMVVEIPPKLIPYVSPRLLQKYNRGKPRTDNLISPNSNEEDNTLHPVGSNMEELYNRDDQAVLKSVNAYIIFESTDRASKPPVISLIDFNIIAWTYRTEFPLPLSLEHDLFYSNINFPLLKSSVYGVHTHDNLLNLKERVNSQIEKLRQKGTCVSQGAFSYLKGISKLGVKKDTIQKFFQSVSTSSTQDPLQYKWSALEKDDGTIEWSTKLDLQLEIANKHNYTLVPSFQNCLVGRLYSLQLVLKFKGGDDGRNEMTVDVPVLVG